MSNELANIAISHIHKWVNWLVNQSSKLSLNHFFVTGHSTDHNHEGVVRQLISLFTPYFPDRGSSFQVIAAKTTKGQT
jgi:hypothetical protein